MRKATAADYSGWECGSSGWSVWWWRGPLPSQCLPKSFSENLPTRQPRWAITSLCLVGWRISVGCFSGLVMVLAWEWKETWPALTDTICQASMRKVRQKNCSFDWNVWRMRMKEGLFHPLLKWLDVPERQEINLAWIMTVLHTHKKKIGPWARISPPRHFLKKAVLPSAFSLNSLSHISWMKAKQKSHCFSLYQNYAMPSY